MRRDPLWVRLGRRTYLRAMARFAAGACVCATVGIACAIPGRLYLVAPEIRGELRGRTALDTDSELLLTVTSREVPTLHDAKTLTLSSDGRFRFAEASLAVAGREFSKVYRTFLHHRVGAKDRVIWRGEFSRKELAGPIELDCDLARPARLGQPCRVRDPLRHPWLIANGQRTFERLCSECHGPGGRGREIGASSSGVTPPGLEGIAARRAQGFDREEVAEWIEGSLTPLEHGTRTMPIWGERLSAEYERYSNAEALVGATLDPVVVFLLSIQEE